MAACEHGFKCLVLSSCTSTHGVCLFHCFTQTSSQCSSISCTGIVSSFGSYQIYYEGSVLSTASSFQISTIGSIQSFLMVFLGFIAGPIYDKGYFSHLLGLGSLLIVIGTITQSFCSVYWQFFLAQGVCTGIGMGCIAIPSVAVPSTWFTTNLPLANGIVVSASGFGG